MTAKMFSHGQLWRDASVDEMVEEITTQPMWRFSEDPMSFIGYCSTVAAWGSMPRRVFWVQVGLRLVAAANNPNIHAGAVLGGLADELGLR